MDDNKVISWQGAEAKIYIGEFQGKGAIFKQRFRKNYRHPILDERLNSRRINQESRCMVKASKCGVNTPEVYSVDVKAGLLIMALIDGVTVKQAIIEGKVTIEWLGKQIGEIISKLHSSDIIHGDLTTSNILLSQKEDLVLIDFGLSSVSQKIEDRAVDLYVLERAINSTHPECGPELFQLICKVYFENVSNSRATQTKLAEVQLRGRKRDMIG